MKGFEGLSVRIISVYCLINVSLVYLCLLYFSLLSFK